MKCEAVVFDLDGTLLNTLADIADAANRILAGRGYPTHPHIAYKGFVGEGSKVLITRALPEDQRQPLTINACLQSFMADYARHWDNATRPYDGIAELIAALQKRAIKMCVVTNKPHRFTGTMMAQYFKGAPFSPVLGQQDGIPKKPHPQQALAAADKMGVSPAACLFLGDSAVDMETAIRADMKPVGAGWGFRSHSELTTAGALTVLAHPLELIHLL